jgi:uncharacterized protein (DUF1015 family)
LRGFPLSFALTSDVRASEEAKPSQGAILQIKPFRALRPTPKNAEHVASVPYDVVTTEEASRLAQDNPMSFLRVIRPEIELPAETDPYADEVYERATSNFQRFQEQGYLIREQSPCLYLYRQKMGNHVQAGIVACCSIDDVENGLIKKHERTRHDKEKDRTRHVRSLNANAGPVFLTYRQDEQINAKLQKIEQEKPLFSLCAEDGVTHELWSIEQTEELVEAFTRIPAFYVADGHHRSAAAANAGEELRTQNPDHTGLEEYNWFLCVLFPADQLQVLPYNRCVRELGMTREDFLQAVSNGFTVSECGQPDSIGARQIGMYLPGQWYMLTWGEEEASKGTDAVAALDVSVLQEKLLTPVLGISDPRSDKRIEFVGGIRGNEELIARVDSGRAEVAFAMHPVTVDQVMDVADQGRIMPPKSTWFEPKLRSGLIVHTLSDEFE